MKRSQFAVGVVRVVKGLRYDARVVGWLSGRRSAVAAYLGSTATPKLHIGAGNNIMQGWLNTDIAPQSGSVVYLDATARFPFADGSFNYIFSEYIVDQLDYSAGPLMLKECYRVLKQGGRVRFATPDLEVLLGLHTTRTDAVTRYVDWVTARWMPAVRECKDLFVINHAFHAWGHQFLYDRATLSHALEAQGFRDPVFFKAGMSDSAALGELESHGREMHAEDINQFETLVVEARK